MRTDFAALKARFKKQAEEKNNEKKFKNNNDVYAFWNMKDGEHALVRLLPDKNEENPEVFFIDYLEHTLSILDSKENTVKDHKISCLKNYGEECPICDLSQKWYKEEGKGSTKGKYFWRNKISLARILVQEDPLPPDDETNETALHKVKTARFGFQLMGTITNQISGDLDTPPWDFDEGYDFKINKTKQPGGDNSTYAIGSGFVRKSSSIPQEIRETIELIDLRTLLPKNPTKEKVQRMLDAHLTGESFEESGNNSTTEASDSAKVEDTSSVKETRPVTEAPKTVETVKENEAENAPSEDIDDEDVLIAQILKRNKK